MNYIYQTIEMPNDYEGRVVVTLISAQRTIVHNGTAFLYIHGYADYFFHDHLSQRCVDEGYGFFAVELRKYGHSKLSHQHFNFCKSLDEYYPDIDVSIDKIIESGYNKIVLLGHSTGGLLAAMYMYNGSRREKVASLVLNSPFFELNTSWLERTVILPVLFKIPFIPTYMRMKNRLSPFYGEAIHKDFRGEWEYDTLMKPLSGIPLYVLWVRAIYRAQRMLQKGLKIQIPILVISSDNSFDAESWDDKILSSDIVLNVDDIRRYSVFLGNKVTYSIVDNAMHDVFLSRYNVRKEAMDIMLRWLKCNT